jgi:adenylate cyclase
MGDYHAGIPEMKEGLLGWKNTGARVGFTFFPVTLAEMCLHAGHFSETARLLEEAAPMIANNDEHFYEPEMCRVEAELVQRLALGGSDSSDAAATHYRRGLDLARKLKGKSWELRLVMGHARLLARSGERGQALSELRQSLSWFTEGHETADLRAARALSESLATPC